MYKIIYQVLDYNLYCNSPTTKMSDIGKKWWSEQDEESKSSTVQPADALYY